MNLVFVTTNRHKFEEVRNILAPFPIELEWLNREHEENHDESIKEVARTAAKKLADELGKRVVVEDTGIFFDAYPAGFPGALPKFVFRTLGYKGIFKLLDGEKRGAVCRTVAGLCAPGEDSKIFTGEMRGTITETVFDTEKDVMPYDHIFIPEGETHVLSTLSMEKKNAISQHGQAFRALGAYLSAL